MQYVRHQEQSQGDSKEHQGANIQTKSLRQDFARDAAEPGEESRFHYQIRSSGRGNTGREPAASVGAKRNISMITAALSCQPTLYVVYRRIVQETSLSLHIGIAHRKKEAPRAHATVAWPHNKKLSARLRDISDEPCREYIKGRLVCQVDSAPCALCATNIIGSRTNFASMRARLKG